jgi:dihydrofolate synthase/folylpolyglutamate synthase
MKITNLEQAQEFLFQHIPKKKQKTFPGSLGLERTKYFLKLLGDPQNKLKIIHIAGTSGKGSTAYLTSLLLYSLGFRVGLHISPHLVDIRERFQISGKKISKEEFSSYLNEILPIIFKVGKSKYGELTYFEILVGLAFYIFFKKRVDYTVMETGMGGWYDATNVVSREDKLVILTKIGLDHIEILGKTISKIAFQKAKIIQEKNIVFSTIQKSQAKKVIENIAKEKKAKIIFIKNKIDYQLGLIGSHQAENASLALATVSYLSKRDKFRFNKRIVSKVLKSANFPGRFEIFKIKNKTVVIDGAHNSQKMRALIKTLREVFPNRKFHFMLAFKKGKDYPDMLHKIIPLSNKITVTSFLKINQDILPSSVDPWDIKNQIARSGFRNVEVVDNPQEALTQVIGGKENLVVITGSFYLLTRIYSGLS